MNLKTIKDISNNDLYRCKSLKNPEVGTVLSHFIFDLRQEIIKWIKAFCCDDYDSEEHKFLENLGLTWVDSNGSDGAVETLMHIFNIDEEDLK